jgi:hypothetical protein
MLYPTPTRARARAGQEAYSARHWQAAAQANPGVGEEELARMLACQWARAGEAERAGAEAEAAADRERCDGAGRVRRGCLGGTGRARLGPGALCGARGRGCGGHRLSCANARTSRRPWACWWGAAAGTAAAALPACSAFGGA